MREILFRGKAKAIAGCPYNNGKPDGEWVFGYIFTDLGAMKIRQFEPGIPECNDYEVDPETIGQYTGLTDKNGVRIFEGDIVSLTNGLEFKVVYVNCKCRYELVNRNDVGCFVLGIHKSKDIEVIGNIHDNPELIVSASQSDSADIAQNVLKPATPENFELMPG